MDFINGIGQVLDPLRLKLLVEVRRRGSIAAAAEACSVSQPSASKHLKKLEDALMVKLIDRSGRASELTEAGTVVADHAARVLGTLTAMQDELRALSGGERGEITIAACTTTGTFVLPDILQCFANKFPGVRVKIEIAPSAETVASVARNEVQLGIAGEVGPVEGVTTEPFLDDELVGIVTSGDKRFAGREINADTLATKTMLMRETTSSARRVADRYIAGIGAVPERAWELGSNEAIKRAVQAGLGIGFLSRLSVADELERGDLAEFRLTGVAAMPRKINLVRPSDRPLTPSERAFARTLSDCCSVSLEACLVEPSADFR